ncbi:Ankyrin-2 [Cichlidogyrus casuarinus]|uniref:Ankyrin-2 n=1 Tax=Cichlidogyrus casuarinus TaxID=1844966 RepID=A0ABD2Q855_9PLAT
MLAQEHYQSSCSVGQSTEASIKNHGLGQAASGMGSTTAHSLSSLHSCHFPANNLRVVEIDSHGRILTTPPPDWAHVQSTENTIAKSQLDLMEVATEIGSDWALLAQALLQPSPSRKTLVLNADTLPEWLAKRRGKEPIVEDLLTDRDRALAVLVTWFHETKNRATGNELDRALRMIGREDVVKSCMRDIQHVSGADEVERANRHIMGLPVYEELTPAAARKIEVSDASPVPESSCQLPDTDELVSGLSEGHRSIRDDLRLDEEKTEAQCISPLPEDVVMPVVEEQTRSPNHLVLTSNAADPLMLQVTDDFEVVRDSESMRDSPLHKSEEDLAKAEKKEEEEPETPVQVKPESTKDAHHSGESANAEVEPAAEYYTHKDPDHPEDAHHGSS